MRRLMALCAFLAFAPGTVAIAQQATDSAPSQQAGDAPAALQEAAPELTPNQRLFYQCQACHTFGKGARTLIGPNLHGIFGRRTAAVEGYRYSANMKLLGETGQVWSDETLRPWLSNPRALVPRTAMKFSGISDEKQLNEFLSFLKEVTSGP